MSEIVSLSIWSDWESESGTPFDELSQVVACRERWDVETGWSCTLSIARQDRAAAYLVRRNVLRVELTTGTVREYRIADVRESREATGPSLEVTGQDYRLDLAERVLLTEPAAPLTYFDSGRSELTPDEYLDDVLIPQAQAAGLQLTKGTVTPTVQLSLDWSRATGLSFLQQLVRAIRDRNLSCEVDVVRSGGSGYVLHLVSQIGSGATTPELHVGRHITGWRTRATSEDQASRVFPFGGVDASGYPATIAHAAWEVTAVAGDVLTLEDPLGGAGPIQFTNQHNDQGAAWYLRAVDGTLTEVQASARTSATQSSVTVDTGDGALFSVGDVVEFRADATGAFLYSLPHPVYQQAPPTGIGEKLIPLDRPALRGERNLAVNPWCDTWSNASNPPDLWTVTAVNAASGPHTTTITRETPAGGRVQFGAYGLRLTGNNALGGARVDFPAIPVDPQPGEDMVSVSFSLYAESAMPTSILQLYLAPIGGPTAITMGPNTWVVPGQNIPVGVRWDVTIAGYQIPAGTRQVDLRLQVLGAYDLTIDAYQVTQTPVAADAFFVGPRANALWQAGNDYLTDWGSPPAEFSGSLIDYARLSPTTWSSVAVTPGCTARVVDDERGLDTSVRAVALEWNRLVAGDTQITWSSQPRTFTGVDGGPGIGRAISASGPTPVPPGTPGNGGTPVTPPSNAAPLGPAALLVPFNVLDAQTLTNLPAATTERSALSETYVDLTPYDYVRLQAHIATPASQGALSVQYWDGSAWQYLDGAYGPYLLLTSSGTVRGQYVQLAPGAKADQILRLVEAGGNGTDDPVVGSVFLYATNHAATPNALCHVIPAYSTGTANILREDYTYTTLPALQAVMAANATYVEPYTCGTLTPRGMRYRVAPGASSEGAVRAYLPSPVTDWSPLKATVYYRQVIYVQPGLDWSSAPSPSGGFPHMWPFQIGGMVGAGTGPAGSIYRSFGEVAYLSMVFDTDWSAFWIGLDPLGTPEPTIPTQTFFDTGLLDITTRWDFTAGTLGVTPATARAQVEINGVPVSDTTIDLGDTGTHFVAGAGFGGFAMANRVETITTLSDPLYPYLGPDHWVVLLNELYE